MPEPMTLPQFIAKYRAKLLLIATDAWAIRREQPSDVGMALDRHLASIKGTLKEMYDDLAPAEPLDPALKAPPKPVEKPAVNGHAPTILPARKP